MPLSWTDDLHTGIDEIDRQHMRIIDYINELEDAIRENSRESIGHVLDELTEYTLSHFAFEESLQEEAGYDMTEPHKAVHDLFAKRIAGYKTKHLAGQDVSQQLHSMLSAWLVNHIKRDDMAYVSVVTANIERLSTSEQGDESWVSRAIGKFFGSTA